MTRRPTAPIPSHLVERFFAYAWQIAEGGFPTEDWTRDRLPTYPRRHAIAALWGVSAALRFSELARLQIADVSPAGLSAWINRSKRGIDGLVQISPRLLRVTEDWRARTGRTDCPLLIPSRSDGALNNDAYNESLKRLFGTLLGIKITSHSFRDTACHLAVSQGASVYEVQTFLGHRSAFTTEQYLRKRQAAALRLHAVDRDYVPALELVA